MGLYNVNPRVDLPKFHGYVENIIHTVLRGGLSFLLIVL